MNANRVLGRAAVFAVALIVLVAGVAFAASVITGGITSAESKGLNLVVKGWTKGGGMFKKSLWLGCTFYPDRKPIAQIDRKPVKVSGKFTEKFVGKMGVNFKKGMEVPYVACLWRTKVSKRKCSKKNGGKPCEYCTKNGYHMEGRVDSMRGTYSIKEGFER